MGLWERDYSRASEARSWLHFSGEGFWLLFPPVLKSSHGFLLPYLGYKWTSGSFTY